MSNPTWKLLQKSQDDDETIEEAIARLIVEHEADEESHLGVGESLQSHKASEIIDHLANSIVTDKILKNQIIPEQFKFGDNFHYDGCQTLDPFTQSIAGSGGSIVMEGYGAFVCIAGSAVGNITRITLQGGGQAMYIEDDPIFECRLNDGSDYNGETRACIGALDPFSSTEKQIGFRCDQANSKVYAYLRSSDGYLEWSVQNDIFVSELYRIEVISASNLINWYINNTLVKSYDYTGKSFWGGTANMFAFGAKRLVVNNDTNLHAWNIFFSKLRSTED